MNTGSSGKTARANHEKDDNSYGRGHGTEQSGANDVMVTMVMTVAAVKGIITIMLMTVVVLTTTTTMTTNMIMMMMTTITTTLDVD